MDNMKNGNLSLRVNVNNRCQLFYDQMRTQKLYRYLILYIRSDNTIDIEKIGTRRCSYEQFLADLHKCGDSDCRFGICDLDYSRGYRMHVVQPGSLPMADENREQPLLLVHWCPKAVDVQKKALYVAGLYELRDCFATLQAFIKATDESDATLAQALEQCHLLGM